MNWAGAIETNHRALTRIVAALIAALELAAGGTVARLPKPLYYAALWVLRPTEAAVRRLIVMAARGLKVTLTPPRPMPKGLVIVGKGEGRHSFQLFDTRKRFGQVGWESAAATVEPRIHGSDASPLSPLFQPRPAEPELDGSVDALRLCRRLAALKRALDTLPAQAQRLARWKARRAQRRDRLCAQGVPWAGVGRAQGRYLLSPSSHRRNDGFAAGSLKPYSALAGLPLPGLSSYAFKYSASFTRFSMQYMPSLRLKSFCRIHLLRMRLAFSRATPAMAAMSDWVTRCEMMRRP
jgi:hypothetical protein